MTTYLAITPRELSEVSSCPLPLSLIAYVIDGGGMLTRCDFPALPRGTLLGLSDRCQKPLPHMEALARGVVSECVSRRFSGVFADFESAALPDRIPFLDRLGALLAQRRLPLYAPLALPAPTATLLVGTAVSGGSLREHLQSLRSHYGARRLALDLERTAMDFTIPCRSGTGRPLTHDALGALRARRDVSVFYSRELAAHYFTYRAGDETHFVLFDDAETLRGKLRLGRELGVETAFLMYPEVRDILPAVLSAAQSVQ